MMFLRLLASVLTASAVAGIAQTPPPPYKIAATTEFRCLWWSPEQQKNYNPNRPPPKETEVVIDHWEYTDPVWPPNPDKITAVIQLTNEGGAAGPPFRVTAEIRWKTGPQAKPEAARWDRRVLIKTLDRAPLAPGAKTEVQIPIDLRTRMTALEKRDWWPYELELIVTGRLKSNGRVLFEAVRPFPIFPGD
jgi:hypothetical protein